MIHQKLFTSSTKPNSLEKEQIVNFLFEHLEEYGDPKPDIEKCIAYALKESSSMGGFILVFKEDDQIIGTVVINQTGMEGYIPENILVYIATHKEHRGIGVGKKLLKRTLEEAKGNIALHVEPENPARFLYEKVGFSSKYVEMRYQKNK